MSKNLSLIFAFCASIGLLFFSSFVVAVESDEVDSCFITKESALITDGLVISSYTCHDSNVVIPSQIDGKLVVEIDENTFRNKNIESVVLPESLQEIGAFAFANNYLSSLVIPDGVERIGTGAFEYNQLDGLEFPQSLSEVHKDAFKGNKLVTINVLGRLNKVGDGSFCDNINDVVEGTSETLEWNFSNACFELKMIPLEEDLDQLVGLVEDENIVLDGEDVMGIVSDDEIGGHFGEDVNWLTKIPLGINIEDLNFLSEFPVSFDLSSIDIGDLGIDFGFLDGILWTVILFLLFLWILFALKVISKWELCKKAGKPGWSFLVPVYRTIVYAEIAECNKWLGVIPWLWLLSCFFFSSLIQYGIVAWILLIFLGLASLIIIIIFHYRVARRFGWMIFPSILYALFKPIVILFLGLGNYLYQSKKELYNVNTSRSLHRGQSQSFVSPVVATEQLNDVVEHFVGADEDVEDNDVCDNKVDDSFEDPSDKDESNIEPEAEDVFMTPSDPVDLSGFFSDRKDEGDKITEDSNVENDRGSSLFQKIETREEKSQELADEGSSLDYPISDLDELVKKNK